MKIKPFITAILLAISTGQVLAGMPTPTGMSEVEYWAKRLDTSAVFQFAYMDAISDGQIGDDEYQNLKKLYTEESKNAEITLPAYKQILALKKEMNSREFDVFISEMVQDNKLTHYEADLIIEKYLELKK